jgi:hypothetical protein
MTARTTSLSSAVQSAAVLDLRFENGGHNLVAEVDSDVSKLAIGDLGAWLGSSRSPCKLYLNNSDEQLLLWFNISEARRIT